MTQLALEKYKGPKPMIPADWIWGVSKFLEDDKGGWYIEGYCSTYDLDLVGDVIEPAAAKEAAKQLVGLTLLYNHDPDQPIGTCVAADADEKGIWVKCLVSKTEAGLWEKIKEGVLNKFSVRLLEHDRKREIRDGRYINRIKKMKIVELSLTSLPANMNALAGLAYVGKTMVMEADETETSENIRLIQEGVKQLLDDYEAGTLTDVLDEELKHYNEEAEASSVEENKSKKEMEVKEMALKPNQGEEKVAWMARCMADQTMASTYADEAARTGQCELVWGEFEKSLTPPPPPPPATKSVEERLSQLEGLGDVVTKLADTVKGLGEAVQKNTDMVGTFTTTVQEVKTKIDTVGTEIKSLKTETSEKIKTLETQAAGKKQIGEGDPPAPGDGKPKDSKWKSAFPW